MSDAFYNSSSSESLPAILAPVTWMEALLTGGVSTSIAVLAVAGVGFGLLSGRASVAGGAKVILGCFILFSAAAVAAGLTSAARGLDQPGGAASARQDPYTVASAPSGQFEGGGIQQ